VNKVQQLKNWLVATIYVAIMLAIVALGVLLIGKAYVDRA
jgi:hypothetical protein